MPRRFLLLLAAPAALLWWWFAPAEHRPWAPGVLVTESWEEAIAAARTQGRFVLIANTWAEEVPCASCTSLRAALREAARGAPGLEHLAPLLRDRFVILEIEARSEEDARGHRGPEAPWGFGARDVPVLLVKDASGRTLARQLGWFPEPTRAREGLVAFLDRALAAAGAPDTSESPGARSGEP